MIRSGKRGYLVPDFPITLKGRKTRARLIDAARAVMSRRGVSQVTMADVAEEAGMSLGALYRYFANKEDLLDSLIGEIHEDLYEVSSSKEADFGKDPYAALYASNYGYLKHYSDNRDVLRILMEVITVDKHFRDFWWGMRKRHIRRFLNAMRRSYGREGLSDSNALRRCEALVSMVEMSAYAWFAQDDLNAESPSIETAAKTVTDIWFDTFFGEQNQIASAKRAAP